MNLRYRMGRLGSTRKCHRTIVAYHSVFDSFINGSHATVALGRNTRDDRIIVDSHWDFGDGSGGTGVAVKHRKSLSHTWINSLLSNGLAKHALAPLRMA